MTLHKKIPKRGGPWSPEEISNLKELYAMRSEASIARSMGRTVESVRDMIDKLFVHNTKTGEWKIEEVETLKKCLGISSLETIARRLGRKLNDVQKKAESLRAVKKSGSWDLNEINLLKQIYGTRTNKDLEIILSRSESSIQRKARILCLSKDKVFLKRSKGKPFRMPRWTQEEVDQLRKLFSELPNLDLAKKMNRSIKSVVSKAHDLGLKKKKSRLRTMGRENVALRRDRMSVT